MEDFVRELSNQEILNLEDIARFKNYIAKKYQDSSSIEKSRILANTVHRVVDDHMPSMGEVQRKIIRNKLIKKTLTKNEYSLSMHDVFETCISNGDKTREFVDGIVSWVNKNVREEITIQDIEAYERGLEAISLVEIAQNPDIIVPIKGGKKGLISRISIRKIRSKPLMIMASLIIIGLINIRLFSSEFPSNKTRNEASDRPRVKTYLKLESAELGQIPSYFRYKNINRDNLRKYLLVKKSLLGIEPYFSTIISVARDFNLNPLVLFAIAGQEQGFVPKFSQASRAIGNNPFNVYHSWKEYNTNIKDTTRIVCATLLNLSKGRPGNVEPFVWINRKYAQDQNWAHGVNLIYTKLEKINMD